MINEQMNMSEAPADNNVPIVGVHWLVEMYGVEAALLRQADQLSDALVGALERAGFHVLGRCQHAFPLPHAGITAMVMLSESHATMHTYPEHSYLAMDLFSCGSAPPADVVDELCELLQPQSTKIQQVPRGGRL